MEKGLVAFLEVLGLPCRDRITGFKGVATSVSFDLYGCVQVAINPGLGADGKLGDGHWFDHKRIEITGERVMPVPAYEKGEEPGPAEKPSPGV